VVLQGCMRRVPRLHNAPPPRPQLLCGTSSFGGRGLFTSAEVAPAWLRPGQELLSIPLVQGLCVPDQVGDMLPCPPCWCTVQRRSCLPEDSQ
jgi:hypothetical protein